MAYYKDKVFKTQVLEEKYARSSQMMGYIDSLYKNFLEPNGLGDIISDLPNALMTNKRKLINRLSNLLITLRLVAAKEASDPNSFYFYGKTLASFNQWLVVYALYVDFIKKQPGGKGGSLSWEKEWDRTLKLLECQTKALDGISSLIQSIGGKKIFIQHALKNSIFMDPGQEYHNITNRFNNIATAFNTRTLTPSLYARVSQDIKVQKPTKSKKQRVFLYDDLIGRSCSLTILKDGDNNTEVKKLLKKTTGYDVSKGAKSDIINYKISHIWQKAFDPRYFTNFWNIVLVPSWANDLLDKTKFSNLFILQLINTYKAICTEFYGMNSLNWKSVQLNQPSYDTKFVVHDTYEIQYFNGKTIATTTVTV